MEAVLPSAMRLLLCCLFLGSRFSLQAAVLHVPAEHTDIAQAFSAAQPGDTVLVASGLHDAPLAWPAYGLSLLSESGPESTVLQGNLQAGVLRIDALPSGQRAVIRGFTFSGGRAGLQDGKAGGGLYARSAELHVTECVFQLNQAFLGGGAALIHCEGLLQDNLFLANLAHMGGGLYLRGGELELRDNRYRANQCDSGGYGGGLALEHASASLQGEIFHSNLAFLGGGVSCRGEGPAGASSFESLSLVYNRAAGGGAIYLWQCDALIRNSILAYSEPAAALECNRCAPALQCNTFFANGEDETPCGSDLGGMLYGDPLFCDAEAADLRLETGSPCWQGECGIQGALQENCQGTAVREGAALPPSFVLHPCRPNPFNPATRVRFELPRPAEIRVTLHDLRGRLLRTLAQGPFPAGSGELLLDGSGLASGVYVVLLRSGGEGRAEKILLLK